MANRNLPAEFWAIYRAVKKAHPEYSGKRLMTVSRYAYNKRYGVEVAAATEA